MKNHLSKFQGKYENSRALLNSMAASFHQLSEALDIIRCEHEIENEGEAFDETMRGITQACSHLVEGDPHEVFNEFMKGDTNGNVPDFVEKEYKEVEEQSILRDLMDSLNHEYEHNNNFYEQLNRTIFQDRVSDRKTSYEYFVTVTEVKYTNPPVLNDRSYEEIDSEIDTKFDIWILDKRNGQSKKCNGRDLSSIPQIEQAVMEKYQELMQECVDTDMKARFTQFHNALQEEYYETEAAKFFETFRETFDVENARSRNDYWVPFNPDNTGRYSSTTMVKNGKNLKAKFNQMALGKAAVHGVKAGVYGAKAKAGNPAAVPLSAYHAAKAMQSGYQATKSATASTSKTKPASKTNPQPKVKPTAKQPQVQVKKQSTTKSSIQAPTKTPIKPPKQSPKPTTKPNPKTTPKPLPKAPPKRTIRNPDWY